MFWASWRTGRGDEVEVHAVDFDIEVIQGHSSDSIWTLWTSCGVQRVLRFNRNETWDWYDGWNPTVDYYLEEEGTEVCPICLRMFPE